MKIYTLLFCLFFNAISPVFPAVVNVLNNGSFEIPGDTSTNSHDLRLNPQMINGWQYNPISPSGFAASGANGFIPSDYVSYPGQFSTPFDERWIVFGNGSSNPGGQIEQYFDLSAGNYRASVWSKGYGFPSEPVSLTFYVFEAQAGGGGGGFLTVTPSFGIWNEYSFEFKVFYPGNFGFAIVDRTPVGSAPNADLYVDNAFLQLVPEPSSISLLALGGVLVVLRRRKK